MYKYDLQEEDVEILRKLYFDEFKSKQTISKIMNIGEKRINRTFKQQGWKIRTFKEAAKHVKKVGLENWREKNGSWNKGLTKADPKMKSLIKKGKVTQIKNGKSKGKNNPMYGKVSTTVKGHRKDLGHATRSSWEANFARILILLDIPYHYEKYTFKLSEGDTYTPDFYIPKKDRFYEIKGWEKTDKHYRFIKQYPDKQLHLIKEREYNILIKKFGDRIKISDSDSTYTKEDIKKLFVEYINDVAVSNLSVAKFQKKLGIGTGTIQNLFKSQKNFKQMFLDKIECVEKYRLDKQFTIFINENLNKCYRREFYTFYSRASSIINKFYGKRFGDFVRDFYKRYPLLDKPNYKPKVHDKIFN